MQPAGPNHPIYKIIVGGVTIASVLNLWLLQALTQNHCAQLDLRLVKISLGACPSVQQRADRIAVGPTYSIFKFDEHRSSN